MPFDSNKISNILGSKIPQWLINQLGTRASQGAKDVRDNDNILFIANKTAWIRLVSSVDIINPSDVEYFRRVVGDSIKNKEDLAKQFVLFGGTSKYLRENSYQQRSGLGKDGAYGILGNDEIQQFGYRPMPGINSVSIDTQGKLGSLRSATISFKCWDKAQLDIIDALYFKLGFTMFLEWGQTFFYPQGSDRIQSSELYSIDPFRKNLTKEEIAIQISRNIRQSEGNYDALLGMVTNFNFTYNQDGGYDCTLKLMALGILGDAIKINNPKDLPNILSEEIRQYNNTLVQIAQAEEKERQRLAEEEARKKKEQEEASQESLLKYLNKEINKVDAEPNAQQQLKIVEKAGIANSEAVSATNFDYFYDVKNRSWSLIVPRLGALIPRENTTDLVESINIDTTKLFNKVQVYFDSFNRFSTTRTPAVNVNATNPLSIESLAQISQNLPLEVRMFRASVQSESTRDTRRRITFSYSGANGKKYPVGIKVEFDNVNPQFSRDSINAEEVYTKAINQIKQDGNFTVSNLTLGIATLKYPDIGEIDSTVNNITDSVDKISRFPIISLTKDLVVSVNDKVEVSRQTTTGTVTTESVGNVDVTVKVSLFITDTALIQSIVKGANSPDYKVVQAAIASQNQGSTTEQQAEGQDAANTQIEQSLQLQSGLELTLRTIQVHALNRAINKTKTPDLEIGRKVYTLPIWDKKDETQGGTPFYTQIFSNGIFSDYITDLIEKTVSIVDPRNPKERLILQSKYGFATELMAGRATQQELKGKEVDFQTLLNAYVVPYQINQEIVKGVSTNHPVYIPLGLLLMILNHSCTIYDTKDKASQTPLVYIDFNPNVNFFLTNTKHLSTNPFKVLIPFEGGFSDYQELFSKEILSANQTSILPLSGSTSDTPLFNTFKQDVLSSQIPSIKFGESNDGIYRGRMMNILLNIDYIIQLVRDYSLKDGTNSIYLKTFLEQIILDINKYLGNFSVLRLAYNDGGNTFHIVDDQVVPTLPEEEMLEPDNTDEIPLVGKYSIAKSLEIRTDVSSKLSSMIAISANADVQGKSTLSTNGDSFGFINTSYKDRFIPTKGDITGSVTSDQDTVKAAAIQFNQTISDFYSKINPSEANVSQATNYYIEKMSKVKNNEYPTRASSMIPVSVNFTTDGISGFTMGQAFTISDQLLPYTYNNRIVRNQKGLSQDHVNKVGFVVVGLTNTIENNQWTTAVRANMIFLKYKSDFVGSIKRPANTSLQFGVNPTQAYSNYVNPANVTIPSGEARKNLVDAINKTNATTGVKILALAQATLEGYYPNTKAYRNNNPGNLRSVQGPFQQFATLEEGAQALVNYINRAISKQNKNYTNANTLVQYINVYAPASDNNDPNGYVASVLGYFRKVGVNNFNSNSLLSEISNFNNNVNLV